MFIFNYCLDMRVDIHYCLPAECTSFLSLLGCSNFYIQGLSMQEGRCKIPGKPGRIIPMDKSITF